jgi:hypothetical protein
MAWSSASNELLNTYRVTHNLPSPAAFTTPLRQAVLTMPGIGKYSPTMARRRDKRRVPKEQLVTAVRKHFNGAAVNELDVVVELAYKLRNKGWHSFIQVYRPLKTVLTKYVAQTKHSACDLRQHRRRNRDAELLLEWFKAFPELYIGRRHCTWSTDHWTYPHYWRCNWVRLGFGLAHRRYLVTTNDNVVKLELLPTLDKQVLAYTHASFQSPQLPG